jgi:hypothetical protein
MPQGESLQALAAEFEKAALTAKRDIEHVTQSFGPRLVEAVRRHASGRPGPNVITGAYLASIYWSMDAQSGLCNLNVTSDAPQAYRLEFGFTGTDATGRSFNQPPYPHFRPASDEMEEEFEKALSLVADLDRAIGGL